MTEERLPLAELLAKAGDGDFLRSVAKAVVQLLMETDVEGLIGANQPIPTALVERRGVSLRRSVGITSATTATAISATGNSPNKACAFILCMCSTHWHQPNSKPPSMIEPVAPRSPWIMPFSSSFAMFKVSERMTRELYV